MLKSTGYVLAAGAIVAANEAIFVPITAGTPPWSNLNWRLIPATALMAIVLGGIEKVSPKFGAALGGLVLLSVLIVPYGNAKPPLQNITDALGYSKKV